MTLPNSKSLSFCNAPLSTPLMTHNASKTKFLSAKSILIKRSRSYDSFNGSKMNSAKVLISSRANQHNKKQQKIQGCNCMIQNFRKNNLVEYLKNTGPLKTPTKYHTEESQSTRNLSLSVRQQSKNNIRNPFTGKNTKNKNQKNRNDNKFQNLNIYNNKNRTCLRTNPKIFDNEETYYKINIHSSQNRIENFELIEKLKIQELQRKLEIKDNQILILQEDIIQLAKSNTKKEDKIIRLQKQISKLKVNNQQLAAEIQQSYKIVQNIINKYSYDLKQIKFNQQIQGQEHKKLSKYIEQELQRTLQKSFMSSNRHLQEIIDKLRKQIHQHTSSLKFSDIKNSLYLKFKFENQEFRTQNYRLTSQLSKIRDRYKNLNSQHDALRIINAKLKKSISDLNKQKQKQIKQIKEKYKLKEKPREKQKQRKLTSENDQLEFCFESQYENNHGLMEQNLKYIKEQQMKYIQGDTEYSQQSENQLFQNENEQGGQVGSGVENNENLNYNISDVSTQELMEMQDIF